MNTKIQSNIFRAINITTYGNGWFNADQDDDQVPQNLKEDLAKELGIDSDDIDPKAFDRLVDWAFAYTFDFSGYLENLGKVATAWIEKECVPYFKKIFPAIINVSYLKTWSPKEYNFIGDEFHFNLFHLESLPSQVRTWVENNPEFFDWAGKKWGSRDGFISFMPYYEEKFWDDFDDNFDVAVAMVLDYLWEIHAAEDEIELERDMQEEWSSNGGSPSSYYDYYGKMVEKYNEFKG
jgi:hypothetical protein